MLTIYNSKGGHIFGGLTFEEQLALKETLHFEPPFYYANGDSV